MKSKLYYLLAMLFIAACSSPKYAYHFDRYDYNSGKKGNKVDVAKMENEVSPIQAEQLLASKENTMVLPLEKKEPSVKEEIKKTYVQMSKSERKAFRADVKKYLKEKKESVKATKSTNAMDNDLKLAAIFGAVGLVALIISGDVFYIIGGIAMIIGVVFFVKWLVRQ
ncbi:MAG TPA: hypothetical protein DIS90_09300 [Cytophagales bacterium]|nr:hypothetical protein [Cytophagales bacterium]HCR54665.1 hypothetical protein [Cytophagales bacterium]